jgi:hypothetical protein
MESRIAAIHRRIYFNASNGRTLAMRSLKDNRRRQAERRRIKKRKQEAGAKEQEQKTIIYHR